MGFSHVKRGNIMLASRIRERLGGKERTSNSHRPYTISGIKGCKGQGLRLLRTHPHTGLLPQLPKVHRSSSGRALGGQKGGAGQHSQGRADQSCRVSCSLPPQPFCRTDLQRHEDLWSTENIHERQKASISQR